MGPPRLSTHRPPPSAHRWARFDFAGRLQLRPAADEAVNARAVWHSNAWVKEAGKGMFFADPYEVYEQGAEDPRGEFMRPPRPAH